MTKIDLNKEIRKVHPKLRMTQSNGYCYFYSNDENLSLYLCRLQSTSVWTCYWSDLTLERWVEEANEVMKDFDHKRDYTDNEIKILKLG